MKQNEMLQYRHSSSSSNNTNQPTLFLSHPPKYDYVFKIILIGETCVGKSAILRRFIEGDRFQFNNQRTTRQTIGVEFGSRVIHLGESTIKLQIWDTAGQERYRSVTQSYYRGAHGVILVYDVTSRASFDQLTHWITDARLLAGPNVSVMICGNKNDLLESQRRVSLLEGSRFAQVYDAMFLETSAVTGINVEEAFLKVARIIMSKVDVGMLGSSDGNNKISSTSAATTTTSSSGNSSIRLLADHQDDITSFSSSSCGC
jgi:Ras-related protein Rab-4B